MDSDLYELIGVERTASTQEVCIFLRVINLYIILYFYILYTRQCDRKFFEFEFIGYYDFLFNVSYHSRLRKDIVRKLCLVILTKIQIIQKQLNYFTSCHEHWKFSLIRLLG